MTWQPSRKWRWSAYTDFAYFAWPKYLASLASHAWDNLFSFAYTTDKWEVTGRYRLKMRQKDNSSDTGLLYKNDHRGRFSVAHSFNGLTLKTQCDIVFSDFEETSFGWMATQHARYVFPKIFDVSLSFGYFHTDDFNSRVYTYERGTLYSFNMPVFYGEGIRSVFLIKADITKKLKLQARLGTTKYFDRSTIGTGYQLIDHSSKTDLGLALSIKL